MRVTYVAMAIGVCVVLWGCPASDEAPIQKPYDIKKLNKTAEKAPDFTLKDIQGQQHKLSDYKDKTVLLVFSTTWCPSCRAEIPHLKKLYVEYQKKGLVLLNIDIQESQAKVSSFAKKNELPYPILLDEDGNVAGAYEIVGVPTTVLIDKDGSIICKACRSLSFLDTLLGKLLGGK